VQEHRGVLAGKIQGCEQAPSALASVDENNVELASCGPRVIDVAVEVGRSVGEVLLPEEGAQGSAIPAHDLSLARTSSRRAAHGPVVLDVPEHSTWPR